MQALWQYNQIPVGNKGNQVSAQIYSKERVDVDGSGAKPVQLVFRDHPSGSGMRTWCCRPAISVARSAR